MDFENAFDRVNQEHPITILGDIGISDPLLTWFFRSFITNKIGWVNLPGTRLQVYSMPSGAPYSSHLLYLLFTIFINGINQIHKHNELLAFADDLKMSLRISTPQDWQVL